MEEQSQTIGMMATFEPLLDSRQAAVLFDVHHKTIERKARSGEIPAVFRFGRWYFRASELDAWYIHGSQSVRVN